MWPVSVEFHSPVNYLSGGYLYMLYQAAPGSLAAATVYTSENLQTYKDITVIIIISKLIFKVA